MHYIICYIALVLIVSTFYTKGIMILLEGYTEHAGIDVNLK